MLVCLQLSCSVGMGDSKFREWRKQAAFPLLLAYPQPILIMPQRIPSAHPERDDYGSLDNLLR